MAEKLTVGFKRLSKDATIPTKAHETDSGFDLCAAEDVIIEPGETVVVKTGIAVKLPPNTEAQVRPRSGVTSRTKLRVQLGTIDNDYRGDIGIIVDNIRQEQLEFDIYEDENGRTIISFEPETHFAAERLDGRMESTSYVPYGAYFIRKGDRLAQLVIQHLPEVKAVEIDELDETERGDKGFGSSGINDTVDCETCGGVGFDRPGTGYDAVCDNCGGLGEHPE